MSTSNSENSKSEHDNEDLDTTRRRFITATAVGICAAYAGAIGYPVFKYLKAPVDAAIAEAAVNSTELKGADKLPAGSTMMFTFKSHPAMLIHFADDTWVALTAVCTHLGCTLGYDPPDPLIICPCHGGQYDPHTGKNVGGPPPKPLTRYEVQVQPGKVTVTEPSGDSNA
jgi:cytochrome b6-f complex iron-sulfur subunit